MLPADWLYSEQSMKNMEWCLFVSSSSMPDRVLYSGLDEILILHYVMLQCKNFRKLQNSWNRMFDFAGNQIIFLTESLKWICGVW